MFVRSFTRRPSNYNYSLYTQRLFTQGWLNYFWIAITYSVLSSISQGKQSEEFTWRWMSLPLRNLYKCKQTVYCYFCILFTLSLQYCCCMFTCLSPFYTNVVTVTVLAKVLRVNKIATKSFSFRWESILNCSSLHLSIKLIQTT